MERNSGVEGAAFGLPAAPIRSDATRAVCPWLCLFASGLLLAACGARSGPPQSETRHCLQVNSGDATLALNSPSNGMLVVTVEERGLSVAARIDPSAYEGSSPVERIGEITLVTRVSAGQTHTVRVRSEDSRDLAGEVCASVEIIRNSDTARIAAESAFARAGQAVHARRWPDAFAQYLAAARAFDRLAVTRRAAQARHAMAELAYRRFDRKRDSYALASAALQDYAPGADPVYVGALATLQAKALIDLPGGELKVLEPAIRKRLATARRYDSASSFGTRELLRLGIQAGFLEYALDAPGRATEFFAAAAQQCRQARDWDCYGVASQNLALFAEERSNYALALSIYEDALRSLDPEVNARLVADIQDNLGHLQGKVGLFSASERTHAAAMREYARLGDCPGFRRTLSRAGSLLVQIGTLGDAENDLAQAASLDCPDLLATVETFTNSAAVAESAPSRTAIPRETASGRAAHENLCRRELEADTLAVDNQLVVFNALLSLGDALVLEGEPASADRCIDAAQSYATTARARMRLANVRGTAFLERDDARSARASFEESLRIADEARIPAGNEHRGSARLGLIKAELLAGDAVSAVHDAYQALQSSGARGDIEQTIASLRLTARAFADTGRTADAAHALQVALSLTEAVPIDELDGEKRATFLATQHRVFAELTELFASQAASGERLSWEAFATSERGRARSLRYAQSQETRDAASSFAVPPSARYQQLLRKVVQLTGSAAGNAPATLIDALGRAAEGERTVTDTLDRAKLESTLARLDATLVEYAVGSRDMFAFVLGGGTLSVVRLGAREEIATAVADLREQLRDGESPAASVRAAARRLARLVLWPLGGHTSGHRLIFIPDDALHTIPFSVLPLSADENAPLMVEQVETVIAPSALFLTFTQPTAQTPHNAPRIELIGDPVFRISDWQHECVEGKVASGDPADRTERALSVWSESLPRLPGTRTEVAMIAKLAKQSLPASRVETLLGCAAVSSALRAAVNGGTDLLHIATHARVDAQRPRLSALALTPDRTAKPMTSAFGLLDILGLKLNSRLVVLSACDTSRGKLLPGEGVLGPAQAFLQAGSAAVLASYWRIDDATTASFMQKFYTHLFAEHLPAAAALRRAQLDAAHTSSSHFWAAFALYGWPDSSI